MSMRDQIVTAAEKLIRTEGLARATTRNIAAGAGCSEGTIYRHFRSQEDVFLAVLTERMPQFVTVMRGIAGDVGKGDVRNNLSAVMRSALEFYQATIPINVAIFAEPKILDRYRTWMREHNVGPHRGVEQLAGYLAKEQQAGRISGEISPPAAAGLLLGSCYLRAYSKQFAEVTPRSDNKFVSDTISLLFHGIRAA
jgi:AcrR family transcriptional regulator